MSLLHRGFLTVMAAAALAVPSLAPRQQEPAAIQPAGVHTLTPLAIYEPNAIEFYLANDVLQWIRPGLKVKVNSVTIGADRKPVVDFTITDDMDQPLDRLGKTTPGPITFSIILAWYDPATRVYTAYTTREVTTPTNSPHPGVKTVQANADSGGTWVDSETGRSKYTFKTVLPANFDATKTHTLGFSAYRLMTDIVGKDYFVNVNHDFRPDGGTVTDKWDKGNEATTCNRCHDPIGAHSRSSRRALKLCALCHQPQTIDPDTGNTVDMKVMVHKIHMGENLPSVEAGTPYQIWGNNQSVHDYSEVVMPFDLRNCENCHQSSAPQGNVWYSYPSAAACGSCHDDVNFTTGANHAAGPAADSTCATCHLPQGDMEFDASIKGAHTIPEKSKQLKGLKMEILSVSNVKPGEKPTVTFKVTNGDGSIVKPADLATCSLISAGPTSDYSFYSRENAKAATFDGTTATYTFTKPIPAGSKGTWAFSADVYRNVNLKRGDGGADIAVRECATNPMKYAGLNGGETKARRTIVSLAKCNSCHDRLALHGGQRLTIDECVTCHNPTMDDTAVRPAAALPAESIDFRRMIHRIHTGEELTQDLTIYGYQSSVHNYNHVLYPGDRRNCLACHTSAASYSLPTDGALSVTTARDYFTPQGPGTASCLGCHDNRDAAAHAYLNTAPFGEACASCHGANSEWSAAVVHAR